MIELRRAHFKKGFDDWTIEEEKVKVNEHWILRVSEVERHGLKVRRVEFTEPRMGEETVTNKLSEFK